MPYSLFGHYSWALVWIGVWPCTAAGAGDICVLCEPLLARDCQGRGCLQCATPGCGIPGWGHCGLYPEHALSQRTQWSFFKAHEKGTGKRHLQGYPAPLCSLAEGVGACQWPRVKQLPWLDWKVLAGAGRCCTEVPVPAGTCQERDAGLARANCVLQR